jgi:hypothetical protein
MPLQLLSNPVVVVLDLQVVPLASVDNKGVKSADAEAAPLPAVFTALIFT